MGLLKKYVYTWRGLKSIGGKKSRFFVSYLGKCVDGWKDFYNGEKPWKRLGYSNPIFSIHNATGSDSVLGKRIIMCLLWHEIHL